MNNNVCCDGCHMKPLVGIRYKCANCLNFDLCENCETQSEETHDPDHVFLKVKRPTTKLFFPRLPNIYKPREPSKRDEFPNMCDKCRQDGILLISLGNAEGHCVACDAKMCNPLYPMCENCSRYLEVCFYCGSESPIPKPLVLNNNGFPEVIQLHDDTLGIAVPRIPESVIREGEERITEHFAVETMNSIKRKIATLESFVERPPNP
jgi:hypothetical protein